eukprot:COSAG01_NODE_11642_length_1890_cov_1.659966_2_plen_182_part_00
MLQHCSSRRAPLRGRRLPGWLAAPRLLPRRVRTASMLGEGAARLASAPPPPSPPAAAPRDTQQQRDAAVIRQAYLRASTADITADDAVGTAAAGGAAVPAQTVTSSDEEVGDLEEGNQQHLRQTPAMPLPSPRGRGGGGGRRPQLIMGMDGDGTVEVASSVPFKRLVVVWLLFVSWVGGGS